MQENSGTSGCPQLHKPIGQMLNGLCKGQAERLCQAEQGQAKQGLGKARTGKARTGNAELDRTTVRQYRLDSDGADNNACPRPSPLPFLPANYLVPKLPGTIRAGGCRGPCGIRIAIRRVELGVLARAAAASLHAPGADAASPGACRDHLVSEEEPMTVIADLLQGHPEVALFAALSLGFFLGKRKVGNFSLGTSAGVLLAGVLIGQLRIPIPALLRAVSFALFIFVVGYRVGPQFFRGLRGDGLRLAALALILSVTGLLTTYAAAMLLGYDKGTAAGLLGGSLTQSAILGTPATPSPGSTVAPK